MIEGYYFGRFQPPLLKHAEIAIDIAQRNKDLQLHVGIADNQISLTRENFLKGAESEELFVKTLEFLNATYIYTDLVLLPNQPFIESLRSFFKIHSKTTPTLIFSGSPSTIKTCQELSAEYSLEIITLPDDDQTGPRARHIRQGLTDGNNKWKSLVAPTVYDYLTQKEIKMRLLNFESGEKRPWAAETKPLLAST